MVTKGIITSIDFNGNTCQVRIPLFETAGNDPITGTAIVSNTPGSYNGYKVGDVVLVAFEDGKMQNPVIVGKLYLGAAKEKQDPRGTINVETTTASKSASLPADAVLTANVDSNVPNTNTPFGSLTSIANNLNSLNTDVNQLDRFTRNQFNSVITDVNDQGEQLRSEIKQTAENIEANVVHKHQNGAQDALGWNLDEKEWKINAQDTVTDENGETKVKDINIVTIDRNGMSIAGDLKLSGYPKNITVLYAKNDSDKDYPKPLYNFTAVSFPSTQIDKTWYYGKYIKIEENYVLIFKENFEQYSITVGTTKAYNREVNSKVWSTETPTRDNGYYIWQWTHTEIYSFDGDKWDEQDDDKITCITGAKGDAGKDGTDGIPATTYWVKLSTAVHTGKNQKSDIEITPYAKTGNSQEAIDTTAYFNYSLDNGASWKNDDWTSVVTLQDNKIVISAGSVEANDIIVKLAHTYTDPDTHKNIFTEYETETITYSPLNTPIIDLNNDTDVIKYKPDGAKITADVSSTAQVYLGGSPEDATYKWSCNPDGGATFMGENTKTITVTGLSSNKVILTCTATTTNFKDENGNGVAITKDFIVSKEVVVASYWLSFSPVHTGNLQTTNIEVKALAKIGNDSESLDNNAYLRYSWDNGNSWSGWNNNATLIIEPASIQNSNLRIQATHDSAGDNRQVYEDETITYSPLNTPVLDLTNDSAAIAYDGNVKLGNSVSSTAVVYLNGSVISGCTFTWTAANCTISGANTATVTVSAINDGESEGTATCRVTGIQNYPNTELVKVFTVAKQYKGNKGTDGPTPASSTTYYIYSADTPSLDDPKWKTDPANLKKPSGGYFCWTKTVTTYSNGKTITDGPNKDAAFALAQGKSTNYYSPTEPTHNIKEGDCWFDTGYAKLTTNPDTKTGYLGKFVVPKTEPIIPIPEEDKIYVKDAKSDKNGVVTRYIPIGTDEPKSTYLVKITPGNIDNEWFTAKIDNAYETGNLRQWDGNKWKDIAGELVTNKLTANYINALDITAKKITVLQDTAAAVDNQKILFEADGTNAAGKVKIADFDVNYESLKSFSETNGYELNIRSAGEIEKNKEITIDDTYMTWEDILVPSSTAQQAQQIRPQLNWDTMEKWPKNGRYDPKDGVDIKDASITDNYTLLHLDTPAWDTTSDIKNDIWLTPQGYISFLKISIEQDILDFNAWIGIISSSSKNELNNSDYLSSQDTIRLFSSTTNFETWEALKTELDKFKSGSASQLSELGYCRPAIGDETSKMPMPGVLTDNLVKFSWGNLSAKTYLYCVVENNYQRDFIVSNSSESGQDKVIEYEDAYGNIHTIIIPAGADATLVPGYLQAFLILDKTFTKYGVAISAGYNGEDFILTGDGKLITSNILVTGGSITADSGNIGPLEISAGEINTAGLMINKSSTHIKNGASLKILGVSGNTTKPIAKLSKNGFIISAQGMQAENNKYFNYKIGEVSGPNDTPNTPGLLWKQRDAEYSTVYVRAKLDSTNKKIIFTLYSDSARTKQYDTKQLPSNKTLDVMVYLKYIKKIIRKRKISRDITIEVDGSAVKTNFIPLPTQLMTTVSPIQFKFKNGDASIQEVSFANISVFDKIYGISNTRGGAPQVESEPLEFTISAPTSINALDPNLYITSSILPASTFEKDGSVTKETKNEYDLGSSTYPWNNVYSKYFYGVSDRREKTNITPLSEQNNLDEFYSKLKPVSFSFKSSNDTLHFGLIAQDVDEASAGLPTDKPLAIVNKSDPNCLSIDYQELIAVNILKIQQLSKKIDSLEAEIKCLKGED